MEESTRNQWIAIAHQFAAIHESMLGLTRVNRITSEQHIDMSEARRGRDSDDFARVYEWFKDHNPFSRIEPNLRSLSTGIMGNEVITCDQAEEVGRKLHEKLDETTVNKAKIKRSEMISGLDSKVNKVTVNKKDVVINPSVLFTRLSALAGREENVEKYFKYELTTEPMSLFKEGIMGKPDKTRL